MAPSRHKRGRSSTSSRASTNVHKTEVTINVYDLLPVSEILAGSHANESTLAATDKITNHKIHNTHSIKDCTFHQT